MAHRSPYTKFIEDLAQAILKPLADLVKGADVNDIIGFITEPPSYELGDLSFITFKLAKKAGLKPHDMASRIADELSSIEYIKSCKVIGGYLNITLEPEYIAKNVIESLRTYKDYGCVPAEKRLRIIVEHTSANPIHPLHIGHARNAFLGDTLANMLRARGHIVQTRFYVNDMGRQVAILALGYKLLGEPEPPSEVKPDEWLGRIYALTNLLIELRDLKRKIDEIKKELERAGYSNEDLMERYRELIKRQDELMADLSRLWEIDRELFNKMNKAIMGFEGDFEEEIRKIMKAYEDGEEWARKLVRRVVSIALEGIKETLEFLGIKFDKWDYESDLVWSGLVDKILEEVRRSPYYTLHKDAEAIDLRDLAKDPEVRRRLNIILGGEIPPLILRRSDGTTLYTTRDIAYTIYKFKDFMADKVINVIGADQKLPQTQLKLALYALGYRREAENLVSYIYEMITVPGMRMSSRRYRIVTLDWLINELYTRARAEVDARRPELSEEEKDKIAWAIAKAAAKFHMAGTDPLKPLAFNFEKALNLKESSAPYLMYTYARANSILEKAGEIDWDSIDYSKTGEGTRKRLLWLIGKYPWILSTAADNLSPEVLASYLIKLADEFNRWYGEESVLREEDPGLRNLKLAITYGIRHVIGHGLRIFGIEPLPHI